MNESLQIMDKINIPKEVLIYKVFCIRYGKVHEEMELQMKLEQADAWSLGQRTRSAIVKTASSVSS
jgi:hypothetical protein